MLIGFCGQLQHGKTTAAKYLVANHDFKRTRFAGPLKDMMRALGLTEHEVDGDLKERPCALLGGRTPRHAMQTLGTEWGRQMIHSDLWINAWKKKAVELLSLERNVVADDVRFPNELDIIHQLGGKVYLIRRPGFEHSTFIHESEAINFGPDGTIDNDGDIAALHEKIGALVGPAS